MYKPLSRTTMGPRGIYSPRAMAPTDSDWNSTLRVRPHAMLHGVMTGSMRRLVRV